MPKPRPAIQAATPEEQLLEKINITQQAVELKISHVASDLEVLYYCAAQYMLTNFAEILTSEKTVNEKKEVLKQLLAEHWHSIKGTSYSYCEQPRDPLNQLCLAIALYISPLPEDLSECDDWEVGEGPYFLLMPDLEACADVSGTNLHQYRFPEFILSADNKRYIPIVETIDFYFKGTSSKPFHGVFSPEEMADETLDKKQIELVDSEISQLTNHSALTARIMENLAILKDPNGSFFNNLSRLADGLFAGSSHGGAGSGDNAAAQANEAIVTFFEYWDDLTEAARNHYLRQVPNLKAIFQRLRDPVSIAQQGVNYCVGVTGGDLRHEVNLHRSKLQSYDMNELQVAVQDLITQLEREIKRPDYTLNPVQKKVKPWMGRLINIPANEQGHLIRQHLHLDYPNFLFYAFDQQPALVPMFIKAFQKSEYKQQIMQQRSKNGMNILMQAAQGYPEALEVLLASCLALNNTQIKDELMTKTPTGELLPFIIMQRCPETLPQLLAIIAKFEKEEQLYWLVERDRNDASIIMMAMEHNANAFIQLCELIKTFTADDIERILGQTNAKGNTLLMTAFLHYPHAVAPLMTLFSTCKETTKKNWICCINNAGLNLPYLSVNAEFVFFKTILDITASMSKSQLKTLLTSGGESFFLKASYSQAENFNAALMLLDNFSTDEQRVFLQERDAKNNNWLLLTMLHQPTPPALLFNKLKLLSKSELYSLLSTRNHEGFSPLTLALAQQPQYFNYIVELLSELSSDQQDLLWQQVDVNGYSLLLLASMYAPEHLSYVLNHVSERTLFAALKQTDFSGNNFLAQIASFHPEVLPSFIAITKMMSVEQRFHLLKSCNQQGDNLLSWMLQQDTRLLDHLFELMEGFTIAQQLSLVTHRNHQNQHVLSIAYVQDRALLNHVLQLVDNLNASYNKEVVLAKLPLSHWFDLLSLSCVNSSMFERLYASYQRIHAQDKMALGKLLGFLDNNNNNLLMLILQNNPTLVSSMIRDVKALSDVKNQRQIMLQKNTQGENALSLAEKYTPDHLVANLQSFLKRLDKQSTKQMMLINTMKMHSGDVLIASDTLENCNAEELFNRLNGRDAQGNNLLGQMIMRMPYRLPIVIKKMQHLLSADQIKQLLAHPNHQGLNCYWLALKQNQAAYLCEQIEFLANCLDREVQMSMLSPPAGQSLIETALNHGQVRLMITMHWLSTFKEAQVEEIIEQFWRQPSKQLKTAIAHGDVDVCQRLISTTRNMPVENLVELMLRNKEAFMLALEGSNKPMKELICRWLLSIPQRNRFEVLSNFSTEVILLLLDNDQMSLVDALPLNQQAQLLTLPDSNGHNALIQAFKNNHCCREKLIGRLQLFTPQQQATLFQANEGNISFLHVLAKNDSWLFKESLTELSRLSSDTQFTLLSHIDNQGFTVLDHLQNTPDLYEQVLSMYDSLSLKNQIQLYLQPTGPQNACLLINAPLQFRPRIVEQFIKFPQNEKIEILLAMDRNKKINLRMLLETLPDLQIQLLDMIQSLPAPVQAVLVSPREDSSESLISWMINNHYHHMKKSALTLMAGLAKTDLSALLKHKNRTGNNLLQDIAKNQPSMFAQAFSIFMSLCNESKAELLLEKNIENRNLFSDLVAYNLHDHFQSLCKTISQLPSDQKINILSASGIVPIAPTTRWVSLLYGSPQCKSFIKLLNNKSFFDPMFHLLLSLPPKTQLTILTNRTSLGKTVIDEIKNPEQTKLRLIVKHAKALVKVKKLLDKMAAKIPNAQVFSAEYRLHQQLVNRLESYQNTYHKSVKHIHDLSEGLINDIEAALPQIKTKLTSTNILTTCLKLAGSVIILPYGGYNFYKKSSTNRHVFFQSDQEKVLYNIEDLGSELKRMASIYSTNSFE
ncbi:hypothetical protein [Legionella yabuuchiae]|uniref:hypothetical protein n=1 Tax=Legionella yabuuchiae TaxID=376727 RepID=UPI00105614EF|nr:hypothetical protein [Legionella yabuuchiae]